MSPPTATDTQPSAGVTSRVWDSDQTTYEDWCVARGMDPRGKTAQKAYLMDGLGLTGCQAKALIRAYQLDERDRELRQRAADAHEATREEFGPWLRSNYWRALRGGLYGKATS